MLTEAALAAQVAAFLEQDQGWTVYKEVALDRSLRDEHPKIVASRADLVGTRHYTRDQTVFNEAVTQVAVVECKLGLSFELIAQAFAWLPYADFISIAVPAAARTPARDLAIEVAEDRFLGVIEVGDSGVVVIQQPTKIKYRRSDALLESLKEGQRTEYAPAGARGGKQFTNFTETAQALAKYVADHPGCKLEEAVAEIRHHYRTNAEAIKGLQKAIKKGIVPGIYQWWKQRLWSSEEEAKRGKVLT